LATREILVGDGALSKKSLRAQKGSKSSPNPKLLKVSGMLTDVCLRVAALDAKESGNREAVAESLRVGGGGLQRSVHQFPKISPSSFGHPTTTSSRNDPSQSFENEEQDLMAGAVGE
jgi:hypothetical protein